MKWYILFIITGLVVLILFLDSKGLDRDVELAILVDGNTTLISQVNELASQNRILLAKLIDLELERYSLVGGRKKKEFIESREGE